MAHFDSDPVLERVVDSNPSASSNGLAGLGELQAFVPYALAFLANDGEDGTYASLKRDLRERAAADPMDAVLAAVLGGGLAFYLAERDTNPACNSPWDGILYMATALSVGPDSVRPTTTTGALLATAVRTFGPALAFQALDPPAAETRAKEAEAAAVNRAILARLEDIVRLLEK
ncbi:MAG: hypothetical protein H0T89_27430 [Deltaproteobacteria bacterium]|nr:hypothetical protein [Deltaproteobacteria bacterium]MDQ3296588.1 hypothetical protein [Myxococcota bacterium]